MAKTPKRKGGPTTANGKAISSANAVTHGLTSKRWLNDDEQSLYEITVEQLTHDFAPKSTIESLLISKLAECTVRLTRTQNVETALYELAQAQAENPSRVIESYESDHPNLEKEVADAIHRHNTLSKRTFNDPLTIYQELTKIELSDISGWRYVMDEMPETYHYIMKQCRQEEEDLKTFLDRQSGNASVVRIFIVGADGKRKKKEMTDDEISKEAGRIPSDKISNYLEKKLAQITKELLVMNVIKELPKRTALLKAAATPDDKKLSLLQRYRTADERQFSKTLGELLELQKRRKDVN